ncbi:MAG: hypothetical protein GY949_02925, partial [Gammaproteobacteria bacterium]|nr:hypothetical protein [Gammaproteobacteria bacterium]
AQLDDDNGYNSGAAYVFTRDSAGACYPQVKLLASDGAGGDQFGFSVALDGDTAVIGARLDDDNGSNSGAAYVFIRDGADGTWSEQVKLLASDGDVIDYFGFSVAVDGDTAVIGALSGDGNVSNSGAAYVFTRDGADGAWSQQVKLLASDGGATDQFGISVALGGDTAVIGAQLDDDNGSNSGAAYVFTRDGADGAWSQQIKLLASDGAGGDRFGYSVALDGDTAVIGAQLDDDNGYNSGAAYVFTRDSAGAWYQQVKLLASDGAAFDDFGYSVALDGDTAVIGARLDDDKGPNFGAAYVFIRDGADGAWSEQVKLLASDGDVSDYFGVSVAVDGDTAVIGAPFDDDNGTISGATYLFSLEPVNQPPVAQCQSVTVPTDTGLCAAASASVDNASFDPDGNPMTLGQSPAGPYALGATSVTLTVTDDAGASDSCSALVTVVDEEAPAVTADFHLVSNDGDEPGDSDEGLFGVSFSAADNCASAPSVVARLEAPGCPSVLVSDGEMVEFEVDDEGCELEQERWIEIEAPSLMLRVTATDAAGNAALAEAQPQGLSPDNDNESEQDD